MKTSATSRAALIFSAIIAFLAFVAMVTVNGLANALPLNGVGTGQLSDEIPNLFVPAGITFAIWGLIYALLALLVALVLVQAFSKRRLEGVWKPLDSLLFTLNALANSAWIFSWHWRLLPLSLALMLVILGTLIALSERIFKRLSPGGALHASASPRASALQRIGLSLPIHVYLGWICVATIANATAVLVKSGWNGWGIDPRAWTVAVIAAGLAIALALVFLRRAVAAPLVVAWAYAGIVIKRLPAGPEADDAVWISALAAITLIMMAILLHTLKYRNSARAKA